MALFIFIFIFILILVLILILILINLCKSADRRFALLFTGHEPVMLLLH